MAKKVTRNKKKAKTKTKAGRKKAGRTLTLSISLDDLEKATGGRPRRQPVKYEMSDIRGEIRIPPW